MTTTEQLVADAQSILREKAILYFDEPIELASGKMSSMFIDGKAGFSRAADLRVACSAMGAMVADAGIEFDAVGGLTLGADHIAVGIAMVTEREWFFVRKEPKGRGTGKQVEGAQLGAGSRVLLVEDVVSTGGSMFQALDVILGTGADVVAATTLLDRGDTCTVGFADRGIPYFPLATYADVQMESVTAA